MAKPLLDKFRSRFHLFTTKFVRDLYVHSKVIVVDDVLLSISSANWNRRSSTSDSEIDALLVDSETVGLPGSQDVRVGALVHRFRLEKFAEMAGGIVEEWGRLSIAQSCDELVAAARRANTFLEPLEVETKWEFAMFPNEFSLHVVDPDALNHTDD